MLPLRVFSVKIKVFDFWCRGGVGPLFRDLGKPILIPDWLDLAVTVQALFPPPYFITWVGYE